MGYKKGTGLGKNEEGRLNPIDLPKHLGKRGFGFHIPHLEPNDLLWDFNLEVKRNWQKKQIQIYLKTVLDDKYKRGNSMDI